MQKVEPVWGGSFPCAPPLDETLAYMHDVLLKALQEIGVADLHEWQHVSVVKSCVTVLMGRVHHLPCRT
jgi:hypothetical protein